MAFARRFFLVAACVASAAGVYFTGDSFREEFVCEAGGGLRGVCAERCDAPPAGGRGPPESCGVAGRSLRCCPGTDAAAAGDQETRGQRSRQMCKKYGESIQPNSCPDIRPFNGSNKAVLGEYPYTAAIGYVRKDGKKTYSCGGALISDRFVLTTGVCVKSSGTMGPPKVVRVGDLNLDSQDDDGEHVQEVEIAETTVHPEYNDRLHANDLALLRLARPVVLSAAVRPACLFPDSRPPTSSLVVAGHGLDQDGKKGVLLKSDPEIYKDDCADLYKRYGLTIDDKIMICAGGSGKDTCQGDSGVAVVAKLASPYCNHAVVGISSFGPSQCGITPSVYTRLYPYLSWIENIVWSA